MFLRIKLVCTLIVITIVTLCYGQETAAERDGKATVSMQMTKSDFEPRQQTWRDTMSWHASRHCKKDKDNCWGADKQIRYHDVVITAIVDLTDVVEVTFYVRDRYNHERAGMSSQQVRSFFLDYESAVENDFYSTNPGDIEMAVVSPGEEGMEGWLIAVITISCIVGVALIITIAVLASRQVKYKNELKNQKALSAFGSQPGYISPEYINLPEGKLNPDFDPDDEQVHTSNRDSDINLSEPPSYNGVVKPGAEARADEHGSSRPGSNYVVFHEKTVGDATDGLATKQGKSSVHAELYEPNFQSINL